MAKNNMYLSDEEKKKRVLIVADHIIQTGDSIRKTAQYVSQNYFPVSIATVHDYINNRLPKIAMDKYIQATKIINGNTPKSVQDAQIKIRIYSAALYMLQEYTIPEIVQFRGSTYDTIYDDLTSRLPRLDKKMAEDFRNKLLEHRLANLKQNAGKLSDPSLSIHSENEEHGIKR